MNDLTRVSEFRLKLYPKDFSKVRKFYEKELGFTVIHEWDRETSKGVMFDVGGTVLELLWSTDDAYKPIAGANVSWEVHDVWKLYEAMKDKPYLVLGIKENPWGDVSFRIADPEGFRISFFTKIDQGNRQ